MADAKAIFNVEIAVADDADYDEILDGWNNEQMGTLFGTNFPGLIVKLIKYNDVTRMSGGAYLFESMENLQGYVNSEFWQKILGDTEGMGLTITMEVYNVTKV